MCANTNKTCKQSGYIEQHRKWSANLGNDWRVFEGRFRRTSEDVQSLSKIWKWKLQSRTKTVNNTFTIDNKSIKNTSNQNFSLFSYISSIFSNENHIFYVRSTTKHAADGPASTLDSSPPCLTAPASASLGSGLLIFPSDFLNSCHWIVRWQMKCSSHGLIWYDVWL